MFDRFQQGDASSTRTHGGLGIGLAIAKQIVELHGGRISAESPGPGKGSTFIVALPWDAPQRNPRAVEPSANEVSSRPASAMRLDNIRVLLVDDEKDAREMLTRILWNSGAVVESVDRMAHAIHAIESFKPQIVLSDLAMPEHDGFELMREVRALGYTQDQLPAIALTGFARNEDRNRALSAGYQEHVAKPVDPYEITAAIAKLVKDAKD
jgi:CheY-like chemotaxis protein